MNRYAITRYGDKYLKNPYTILGLPSIHSSIITLDEMFIHNYTVDQMELIDTYHYDCKLIKVGDKLVFNFFVDETAFELNFKSLFIGFKQVYDSELNATSSEELKRLIYIDPTNLYDGIITENPGEESIVTRREKSAQLQYGFNSIIIKDNFKCTIIPDEELDCDISELSTKTQIHNVYPYYENF